MKSKAASGNIKSKIFGIFIFLFIASVFSIFNKFSKDYTYQVAYRINYEIPPNRFLVNNPPELIMTEVRGTGWLLFFESIDNAPRQFSYNCSEDLDQAISKTQLLDSISGYFNKYDLRVSNIYPDNIPVNLGPAEKKVVKVFQPVEATYFPGYGLVEPMKLSDSTITVYGSREHLSKIDDIYLDTIRFEDLKESQKVWIELPFSSDQYIRFEKAAIALEVIVDQFTQKSFTLPLALKNFPQRKSFEIIPNEITLLVEVPLIKYSLTGGQDFELQINYFDIQKTSERRLAPVTVAQQPKEAKNLVLRPQFVEVIEIKR